MYDRHHELIELLIADHGSLARAALVVGVTKSRLSRARAGRGRLNVENTLKLAEERGANPVAALKDAGYTETAARLERLFVRGQAASDSELLALWQALRPAQRNSLQELIRDLVGSDPPRKRSRKR